MPMIECIIGPIAGLPEPLCALDGRARMGQGEEGLISAAIGMCGGGRKEPAICPHSHC